MRARFERVDHRKGEGRLSLVAGGLGCVLAVFSVNSLLTLAAFATLAAILYLTLRPGEPPVLTFAVAYQWVQAASPILLADIRGERIGSMDPSSDLRMAAWLSLAGLLVLAAGIRLATASLAPVDRRKVSVELSSLSLSRLWVGYAGLFVAKGGITWVAWRLPGLRQIVLTFEDVRWFFFFLFAVACFARRQRYSLLAFSVGVEILLGFVGYFSSFKEVLFVLALAFLTSRPRLGLRTSAVAGLLVAFAFLLGSAWMLVREDFRLYVSGGERAQIVTVPLAERLDRMASMIGGIKVKDLGAGLEALIERIGYVEYFGKVVSRVPSRLPYEGGSLWWTAVRHVLTPRLLFPTKPNLLSDSELTMKYTGEWLASDSEGTSISMGYFAESYIDFGSIGMMAPIFVLGLIWGCMYRYFLVSDARVAFSLAAAVTVLLNANQFEIHNVKLLGGMLTIFAVIVVTLRLGSPALQRVLAQPRGRRPDGSGSPWPVGQASAP